MLSLACISRNEEPVYSGYAQVVAHHVAFLNKIAKVQQSDRGEVALTRQVGKTLLQKGVVLFDQIFHCFDVFWVFDHFGDLPELHIYFCHFVIFLWVVFNPLFENTLLMSEYSFLYVGRDGLAVIWDIFLSLCELLGIKEKLRLQRFF